MKSTKQSGDMTRSTTQLGDTTRRMKQIGGKTRVSVRDVGMPYIEQEGSQTAKAMTGPNTQSEGKTRSTAQLGDAKRLMERMGGQASAVGRDVWNVMIRGGTRTIRGYFMPHI